MIEKLTAFKERFEYLEQRMADPSVLSDQSLYTEISKEYADLKDIVQAHDTYSQLLENINTANEMLQDPEMKELAELELSSYNEKKTTLEEEIKMLLIPKDPEDEKDVIIEIRSGTGGDEASIFAGDLYRMYTRYFDSIKYKYEVIDVTEGTVGGYSKVSLEVSGNKVYGQLKFESGAHRVQRVPETESQGRVHTSAATVVVMPKLEMEDVDINKADLKVDTFRSSGAGGQHVNKTESGVRFTHLPTGVVAESTDGRSQIKNREIALQRLIDKIRQKRILEHDSKVAAARKSLVGSGDRSDKIRTYNFPQNRITDHRINFTAYNLDQVINGDLTEIIEALKFAEYSQRLEDVDLS